MLTLIIDNREKIKNSVIDTISNCKLENLSLGDYIYRIDETDFLVIERKTISDYAASIQDGRNREQKARLLEHYPKNKIIYLVEGSLNKDNSSSKYNRIDADTIVSSIINTMLRDEIQVFHTANSEETVFLLKSIYKKLDKQGTKFLENKETYENSLVNTNKTKKGNNITPNIVFKMMLNCIPGVSNKVSDRLVSKFRNIKELYDRLYEYDTEDEMEKYIINIKMDDTEKGRKISKNISKNIISFLNVSKPQCAQDITDNAG